LTLTAPQLRDAVRAGVYRLYRRTDHINRINVFPVPDGDTGTNMAMTLSAVLAALEKDSAQHAGKLLTRAADAALDGARGNSGAILAQFFLGLAERTANSVELTLADFSAGVDAGAGNARLALLQPREGTILTIIADFATQLAAALPAAGQDYRAAFVAVMPQVRASLLRTPEQLEELRGANVVDAGAAGFVEWLEGFSTWLETGEVGEVSSPVHGEDEAMAAGGAMGVHRFCTECLVAGARIDLRKVRESLNALGSSLVVSGHPAKLRIHIHCNDPEQVFTAASQFGVVSAQKADDMLRQQTAAHHDRRRHVAVVTDSAADIPAAALETLDIYVVPVRVQFGAHSYLDKVTMTHDEFYRLLATSPDHPKTSQPPPGDFRRMFEFLASHYDNVVSINLTSRVSGTFNAALTAAERVGGRKVEVIDSRNASLGQGLIAMAAAECAAAGGDGAAVAAAARAAVLTTDVFGLLARMDFAVRGGRVPRVIGKLAEWLRCSPVLANYADGRVTVGTIIWSRKRSPQRFAAFVRRKLRASERYRIAVGHANAEAAGQELLRSICAGQESIEAAYLTSLGPALGVHGGPGMLVVGIQTLPRPIAR
jgi:DegV family protein with EDD domain